MVDGSAKQLFYTVKQHARKPVIKKYAAQNPASVDQAFGVITMGLYSRIIRHQVRLLPSVSGRKSDASAVTARNADMNATVPVNVPETRIAPIAIGAIVFATRCNMTPHATPAPR